MLNPEIPVICGDSLAMSTPLLAFLGSCRRSIEVQKIRLRQESKLGGKKTCISVTFMGFMGFINNTWAHGCFQIRNPFSTKSDFGKRMGQTLGNMCHFLLYRVGTWPWPIKHRRTFGNLFLEAHEIFMKKIIINYHELSKRLGVDPAFYCDLRLNHLQGPTAPGLRDRLHRDWGAWLFAHVQQIHRGRSSLRLGLSHWMCIIVDGYIVYIRMYMCIYIIYTM